MGLQGSTNNPIVIIFSYKKGNHLHLSFRWPDLRDAHRRPAYKSAWLTCTLRLYALCVCVSVIKTDDYHSQHVGLLVCSSMWAHTHTHTHTQRERGRGREEPCTYTLVCSKAISGLPNETEQSRLACLHIWKISSSSRRAEKEKSCLAGGASGFGEGANELEREDNF